MLPVLSGALAGVAAVSLGFGSVHGITLGFGTALIGEAVDYSIYLFVQSEQGADRQDWLTRFWPTIRLGVLTSIFGFASLLLSGFPGLAQLGLYAIAGLVAAAAVTRFVLPHLLPLNFRIHDVTAIGVGLSRWVDRAAMLRWAAALVLLGAGAVLVQHRANLWSHNISSLSPVSQAEVALDTRLRADMGGPDVRYLVVVSGASQEAVLRSSEQVAAVLQAQVDRGELAGFESPSRYLPSAATQRARQASLPPPQELEGRVAQAVQGLPVRAQLFAPFVADVAAARTQPLLQAGDLEHTSMAMALQALLIERNGQWSALLPLNAPKGDAGIDGDKIRGALDATGLPNVLFVDMKGESDRLYSGYLREAGLLSLGGLAAIVLLLLLVIRSPLRVLRIVAPLAAAVVTVTAGLIAVGPATDHPAPGGLAARGGGGFQLRPVLRSCRSRHTHLAPHPGLHAVCQPHHCRGIRRSGLFQCVAVAGPGCHRGAGRHPGAGLFGDFCQAIPCLIRAGTPHPSSARRSRCICWR